ncbi:MAG TPA: kelch repeat-containing protein [Tepidisphaeraceae bacterium]|jgi:hypothetical protein
MSRLIESLESRNLMHASFAASINFQPLNAPRAPGLLTDYGATYDVRRGGLSYGWSADARANAVDRNLTNKQKNDTFIAMQTGGNKDWDIAVENGTYDVYVVAGDPGVINERMGITLEGEVAVSGITRKTKRYLEGLTSVEVTDGRLTLGNTSSAVNNKICYIGITSTEPATQKTLTVSTPVPLAKETGRVAGKFTVTRTGDVSGALTVPIAMSGTATNGEDYGRFGRAISFAAGESSIDLRVRVETDSLNESNETVTLTIGAVSGYTRVEPSATVTIQDAASPTTPTTLAWATKAARPVAASELFGGAVGNVLYTMGGFVDNTFKPTKAVYAYDVTSNAWTRKADLPVGLTHPGAIVDGTSIYFAGGYPGNGSNGNQTFSTRAVYRYNTTSNTYTALPDLPVARGGGPGMAVLNNVLYVMGGTDANRNDVTSVYALDLGNLGAGWQTRASLPAPRNHAAAVAMGGSIYFVGGQVKQDAQLTTQRNLYRYDTRTNAWTTLASMPGGRSHITDSTFVYNDKLIVLAGQSAYEAALATNIEYDPASNTWKSIASLPAARFSGKGDLVGTKFVYTGGYNGAFKNNTYVGTLS